MISAEPVVVGRVAVGRMHFLSVLFVRLVVVLWRGPVIGGRQVDRHLLLNEHWVMLNYRNRYRIGNRYDRLMMLVVI